MRRAVSRGARAALGAILVSSVLAAVKTVAGVVGNSYALIADGVESMLDIVSTLVVWASLRIAAIPPDENHPYGHGKAEPLGALVISIALLGAAAGIAIQSVREIASPHHAPAPFTLVVLVVVVIAKELMFRVLVRTGRGIGSRALETDAWHHRSDALTSAAAFVGISVSLIAGEGYESADDWAALFACAVIAYNGVRLFRGAFSEVMDAAPPVHVERRVRELAESLDDVLEVEKCRIRKSGFALFVDIHVVVDGTISVRAGHAIAHAVKDALVHSELGIQDVIVHIEPGEPSNPLD